MPDTDENVIILYIYIALTVVVDLLVFYCLHRISTVGPSPNQHPPTNESNKINKECCLTCCKDSSVFFNHLFAAQYPSEYYLTIDSDVDAKKDEQNDNSKYFVEDKQNSLLYRIFDGGCSCKNYVIFSLQLWAFCCGFLAVYLSLVFWLNLFAEFTLTAVAREGCPECGIAIIGVYFLIELIFWFLKRQIESVALLTRNCGDKFKVNIIFYWRIYDAFLCIFMAGFMRYESSTWLYQFWIQLMIIRGLLFQTEYTIISYCTSVFIVCKSFTFESGWIRKFIFAIEVENSDNDEQEQTNCCPWWIDYFFVIMVFVLIIVFFGMTAVYAELFIFAAVMLIIYYLVLIFDRAKYDSLHVLWSAKFHFEYFQSLGDDTINDNDEEMLTVNDQKQYKPVSATDDDDDRKEEKQEESTVTVSDSVILSEMNVFEFHKKIKYKTNSIKSFCCYCSVYGSCNFSGFDGKECGIKLAQWFCFIVFVVVMVGMVGIWLEPDSDDVSDPPTYTHDVNKYPICMSTFGTTLITWIDLVYLAKASSYIKDKDDLKYQLGLWFGWDLEDNGWDVDGMVLYKNPKFFHARNDDYDFDFVVPLPTMDTLDQIQDVRLWGEACLFRVFSVFIPLSDLLPLPFIRNFVVFCSIPEDWMSPGIHKHWDDFMYDYIVDDIENGTMLQDKNDSYLFMTGHSLGAGLSDILGGRLYHNGYGEDGNIVAFSVGSPGTLLSSKKFGYDVVDLDKSSVSLITRRDMVAHLVDLHGGVQQEIKCNQPNPFQCHYSIIYFCELYQSCSNHEIFRNLSFTKCACDDKHDFRECW